MITTTKFSRTNAALPALPALMLALIAAPMTSCDRAATQPATEPTPPSAMNDATTHDDAATGAPHALNFTMNRIDGTPVNLAEHYKGRVVLIVNVASKCGLTPQYAALQQLHETYADHFGGGGGSHSGGLAVLGFPANEFGNQEPGTNDEIAAFCEDNFNVTFDLFEKIIVKGEGIAPLYMHLTSEETNPAFAGEIQWNFTKFLIDREGRIVNRFSPRTAPDSPDVIAAIEAALRG